jgi:hypothetical protein
MQLSATGDVPQSIIETLAKDLCGLTEVEVDRDRMFYKSATSPSWVALLQPLPTWAALLGPCAAVLLTEVLKEAGKDLYRNKAAIGRALTKPVVAPLRIVAEAIARFRRSGGRTRIEVGAPVPDDHFGTRLRVEGQDVDSIALELALFVRQCGAIEALLAARDSRAGSIGDVSLTLAPDGAVQVQWMNRGAEIHRETLPPPAP